MALILQLVLSVENSIFEAISYIFKLFSRLTRQYIVHKLDYLTNSKQLITSSYEEEKHYQEIECSSVHNDSESGNKTKARLTNNEHNEDLNKKHRQIPKKTNRTIFGDSKLKDNVIKKENVLERQLSCIGDNCDSLKPVMPCFEHEAKLGENICSSMLKKEIRPRNRSKVNTVSKYTISFMDILGTKTDRILKLIDELDKTPPIVPHQLHEAVSKDSGPHDHLSDSQNGSEETRSKNHHFSRMKSSTETQDEENIDADLCHCLDTHRCLLYIDSEDDSDNLLERRHLSHAELAFGIGYAIQDELLTPEELASVETGSDDNWLYQPMQSELISVSA